MITDLDVLWRALNIIFGVAGFAAVLAAAVITRPGRAERLGMVGGAALCLSVALGSAAFLAGFDGSLWLPLITFALLYVTVGRVVQLIQHNRKKDN